jgi:hypothetical protein
MFDKIKNLLYPNRYKGHSEAIIISCFFNPQNSPYRIKAFNVWYDSIKHLNHKIIECVIGDSKPQLPENNNIERIYTESLLWHKETLLNKIISELPPRYKYIFWIDADVIFTNKNWLVEGVEQMQNGCTIIQPFEYCVHLDKDQLKPEFDLQFAKAMYDPNKGLVKESKRLWRSFSANWVTNKINARSENYDVHGHVGFAWGATRELLDEVPLYDKALIGGADHIIAHAAAGQIPHCCITKSFKDDIQDVLSWSKLFYAFAKGKIGYVQGDLFHIWHGDINKRDYFNRIVNFTSKAKEINIKDKNGLYVAKDKESIKYMKNYFKQREVDYRTIHNNDDRFWESFMYGYMFNDGMMGGVMGGNYGAAMLGDMLNNSDENVNRNEEHHNHNNNTEQEINHSHDHSHKNEDNINTNINTNTVNDSLNVNEENHNHNHEHHHDHSSNNNDSTNVNNNDIAYNGSTFS